MSSKRFETFLARLFVDADFREAFLRDPGRTALQHGLDASEAAAALAIDRPGLRLAAHSFATKRMGRKARVFSGLRKILSGILNPRRSSRSKP